MSTRSDRRPPRELVALRIEATVVMSLAIGQAGLAAGFLGGQPALARTEIVGLHIFSGVLFVVLATLLTSYLYRPGFVPADPAHPGRG